MIQRREAKRYCYKIHMKSELGKAFLKLWHLCDKAEKAADKFAAKVGAKQYYPADSVFAGGVACVSFEGNQPPLQKVWRKVGKDADGIVMWEPDVKMRGGFAAVKDETKLPADTATRIYGKMRKNAAGNTVCDYIELYRDDKVPEDKTHPKRKTPLYWSKSFRIEKERLKLPVVTTMTVLNLIKADLTADRSAAAGKIHVLRPITPTFFKYSQSIYLRCAYPCNAEGLKEISIVEYANTEAAVREASKVKGEE